MTRRDLNRVLVSMVLAAAIGFATARAQAPASRVARARAHLGRGEIANALTEAIRAHTEAPDDSEAALLVVIVYYRMGALDSAEAALREVPASDPMVTELTLLLAQRRRFDRYLAAADLLQAAGSPADAAENVVNAWRIFPSRHDVAIHAAELYVAGGACRTARLLLDHLRQNPAAAVAARAEELAPMLATCATPDGPPNLRFESCNPGMVLSSSGCRCAGALPVRLEGDRGCVPCPAASVFTGTRCECASTAQSTTSGCSCPNATPVWSTRVAACVPCGAGAAWDEDRCHCPPETAWDGSKCACTDAERAWDGAACVPRSRCQVGSACGCIAPMTWGGERCVCPAGMQEYEGACLRPAGSPLARPSGSASRKRDAPPRGPAARPLPRAPE